MIVKKANPNNFPTMVTHAAVGLDGKSVDPLPDKGDGAAAPGHDAK